MKNLRISAMLVLLGALTLALAACMNTGREPEATLVPGAETTAGASQEASFMPEATESAANGTAFDWRANEAQVEDRINQISEIAESRVVVTGSTALVGVKFAPAYKGEMTERIREMVASEVLRADPTIQTVAVTADAEDVKKVYDLSEQIRAGRTADELAADINSIVRNATTLR